MKHRKNICDYCDQEINLNKNGSFSEHGCRGDGTYPGHQMAHLTILMRFSGSMVEMFPNNCPLIEKTADGVEVGACWFGMKNDICPRHGYWKKFAIESSDWQ